jgi:P27 family predicted phage terminase small subunit
LEFIAVWKRVVNDFPPDYFRESDRDVMTVYCRTVCQYEVAARDLEAEGFVIETPTGSKQNPLVAVQTQLSGTLSTYARMLRITPVSRHHNTQVPKTPALKPAVEEGPRKGLRLAGVG